MKNNIDAKNLSCLKKEEVKSIKDKPRFCQKKLLNQVVNDQSHSLSLKVYAPIFELKEKMKNWHMINKHGKPKANGIVFKFNDISIIRFFKKKALAFLNYYKPAANFYAVKQLVDYHMRWSLLHTLAGKHSLKIHLR